MLKQLLTYAMWAYSLLALFIGFAILYALYLVLFTNG